MPEPPPLDQAAIRRQLATYREVEFASSEFPHAFLYLRDVAALLDEIDRLREAILLCSGSCRGEIGPVRESEARLVAELRAESERLRKELGDANFTLAVREDYRRQAHAAERGEPCP